MSSGADGPRWSYVAAGKVVGPITDSDLKKLIAAGIVFPETKIRAGDGAWVAAGRLGALVPLFRAVQSRHSTKAELPPRVAQPPVAPRLDPAVEPAPPIATAQPFDLWGGDSSSGLGESIVGTWRDAPEPEPPAPGRRPGSGRRRQFRSLQTVASITDWIAVLYLILAVIGTLGFIGFCFTGGAEAVFIGLVGGATYLICMLIVAVFIRAMAEGIRLVLYAVELLEDIRDSRG